MLPLGARSTICPFPCASGLWRGCATDLPDGDIDPISNLVFLGQFETLLRSS